MADVVNFPPTPITVSQKHEALRKNWRTVDDSVRTIMAILHDTNSAADLTDDQKFQMEWELEWLLTIVRADAFQDMRLPADEYRRRRERLMRSLGLGHLL